MGEFDEEEWVRDNWDTLDHARDQAVLNIKAQQGSRKKVWDKKAKEREFKDDKVLLRMPGMCAQL